MTTNRLNIRLINDDDLSDIHHLHSLPATDKYNTLGIPESIEQTKNVIEPWISNNKKVVIRNYTWAVEISDSSQFIGLCALNLASEKTKRGEVWYKFDPEYWNKGYAVEAMQSILKFVFEDLKLHRLEAGVAVENLASIKLLEKLSMLQEGRSRLILPLSSGWSDNYSYAMLESDYESIKKNK